MTWTSSIPQLGREAEAYIQRIERAALRAGERMAEILEEDAKRTAPWADRTGAARRGLFGVAELASEVVTIYLSHGKDVDYGKYLETRNAERYAVIWPTISRHMDEIWGLIREELGQ